MQKILLSIIFLFYFHSKQMSQNAAIGSGHFHAICSDGTSEGWGVGTEGELGNGSFTNSKTPVPVNSLANIVSVASGSGHCVALKSDGTVWTWGSNSAGQLGDGSSNRSNIPIKVSSLSGVIAVSAGIDCSIALKNDGTVWEWGTGIMGDGATVHSNYPVQVFISDVIAIAGGYFYTLALKSDGTVWAWGHNIEGRLGNATMNESYVPVQVNGLANIIAIRAGGHSFALKNDGTVWAWGSNAKGELGDGTISSGGCYCKPSPVQSSISNVRSIAAGGGHSIAVKNDGTLWAWGYNEWGQLGTGNNTNSATPVMLNSLSGISEVAAGWSSLAIKNDGTVWTWGEHGNPNTGDTTNHPMQVSGLCQVAGTSGIEKVAISETEFSVFPNPTSKTVTIHVNSLRSSADFTVKITDSLGKTVYTEEIKKGTLPFTEQIDLSSFAKGVYFIDLLQKNKHSVQKIVLH